MSHALWHPRFRVRADVLLPAAATRPRPAPRRTGPGKTLGLDDSSREIYYPDNIQPSPGPGLMCKLMCVCVWCPARMSGNGGMHYSDRTHISHEILAVFSFLVCHVMKDPNLLKGEVRSVDSHHALTPSRTFILAQVLIPVFRKKLGGNPWRPSSERARPLLRGRASYSTRCAPSTWPILAAGMYGKISTFPKEVDNVAEWLQAIGLVGMLLHTLPRPKLRQISRFSLSLFPSSHSPNTNRPSPTPRWSRHSCASSPTRNLESL